MKGGMVRSRRYLSALALFTFFAGSAVAAPPGVRHVRADAGPGGDGLTWATAYNDLRQALITAGSSGGSITELWVKRGSYSPGGPTGTDPTLAFTLVSGVAVYGGFWGTETARDQRLPAAFVTVLSGQGAGSVRATNVVVGAGDASAILDGFTITGGRASEASTTGRGRAGGGIHITGSPTIRQCTITANTTLSTVTVVDDDMPHAGGGVYCAPGSAPTLIDCLITANTTGTSLGSPGYNGAGLAAESASVHLIRCTFRDNVAGNSGYGTCTGGIPSSTGDPGHGGGIFAFGSALLLDDCTIDANRTATGGDGIECGLGPWPGLPGGNGAGLCAHGSTIFAVNSLFMRNRTGDGGQGRLGASRSSDGGDGGIGGGLFIIGGDIDLINCTIAGNAVGVGGASGSTISGSPGDPGYASGLLGDASTSLENCISWNDGMAELVGALVVRYSDVRGGFPGTGNINADPLFLDAAGGDYRLADTSPCIDAGNSFPAGGSLPATDADGLARRVDVAAVTDTGVGPPVVDMGAYEVQSPCVVDLNGDGLVDFADYLEFLNLFDADDLRVDFTGDGLVDFSDYLEFLNLFDAGC